MKRIFFLVLLISFFILISKQLSAETYSQTITKDGKTYITTKTVENGNITIETKIYDENNNLLDTKVTRKDAKPTPIKEIVYPTKTVEPTITKTTNKEDFIVREDEESGKGKSTSFLQTDLTLDVSSTSGNIVVKTQAGDAELGFSPDLVVQKAESMGINTVSEVRLIQTERGLKYVVNGTKNEKLLGLIKVYLPTTLTYNTETGVLEDTKQTLSVKIVDFLSI